MNIIPAHWSEGVCFKCVRHTQCHTIGDAAHRYEEYELDRTRWHDLIEWIRVRAEDSTAEMPESVKAYLDDPKTVRIRAQRKRGYIALEDFA